MTLKNTRLVREGACNFSFVRKKWMCNLHIVGCIVVNNLSSFPQRPSRLNFTVFGQLMKPLLNNSASQYLQCPGFSSRAVR